MSEVLSYKGFISCSYAMILNLSLLDSTQKVISQRERNVGPFEEEHLEEALLVVSQCSLNVAQHLSQLYILLRVHYTPANGLEWECGR